VRLGKPVTELAHATLTQLGSMLDRRQVSAVELATHFLERIGQHRDLNAFLDVRPEQTLAQAHAADERRAHGETGALLGVPIAHKDVFVTRNWHTTASSRILEGYKSPFDATVVEELARAGMVCLGKLNCDEFAMGSSNENSAYGNVLNPWDRGAVPGGSSGGSAAAVAARLTPIATGTDTGGSIREPAAFSGVTDGSLLRGVRYFGAGVRTHTLVMTTEPHLVRFIDTIHATDDPDVKIEF
jgi:aspartyl-tRNA(Asn)/glutamyl-tRNA(Gln) amidotransferase subunit A